MSNPADGPALRHPATEHPSMGAWTAPGGPLAAPESLDDVLGPDGRDEAAVAAAAGALRRAGVQAGDAVAWQLPNSAEAVTLFRAAWRLGAVAVPVHAAAGPADVESIVGRARPAVVLGGASGRRLADLPAGPPVSRGDVRVDPASIAVALGTAGSTGRPKLVLHTHRALVAKARLMAEVHQLGPEDCFLLAPPLAHISGLLSGVLLTACGMRAVPMARWDPEEAVALVEAERVTFMVGPPAFFVSMLGAAGFRPDRVASLRQISCGGAGVTPAFVRSTAAALGCRVKRAYGSTEAPTVTTSTLDDPEDQAAETDGRAVGWVELRTVDPVTGLDVAPGSGAPGEVWVRAPELFAGYDDEAATAAALAEGGWFRTGDLGSLDSDGWLTIVGRLKDVIIRGGENIVASAVEAVLEAHPAVRQAAVVGEPDERLGERVCAFVEAEPGFDLAACRAWFEAQGATRFTWPERVVVLDALPLLPAGKPDRTALRALL